MDNYLTRSFDWKTEAIAYQYDELPLWSAPFGLLLLDNFPIGNYKNYLDIGFGTGFPLLEIAQRLGSHCHSVGIDPWTAANRRAQAKIAAFGLGNIELVEADAASIPFPDHHFDLITSNLGINNFDDAARVLAECRRVLHPQGRLCTTTNLTGTFQEFYAVFEETLTELGLSQYTSALEAHINHRQTVASSRAMFEAAEFGVVRCVQSNYLMRFYDGSAFLNHAFIILGFIDSWRGMFEEIHKQLFFNRLEQNLNAYARQKGELNLTIPMAYFECAGNG